MNCDLITHQIPTQSIILSVKQGWQNEILPNNAKQIGVIAIPTGEIFPFSIKLEDGTWFKGFKNMVFMGISHIVKGTDGLAFAETLTNIQLSTTQMALSILGFNDRNRINAIIMHANVFPILILPNEICYYPRIRQIGAIILMILAFAWMIERIQDKHNFITELIA